VALPENVTVARAQAIPGWTAGAGSVVLPGLLPVIGLLPYFCAELRQRVWIRTALAGVNASVAEILPTAVYRPVRREAYELCRTPEL
jgi:hypothetical protein